MVGAELAFAKGCDVTPGVASVKNGVSELLQKAQSEKALRGSGRGFLNLIVDALGGVEAARLLLALLRFNNFTTLFPAPSFLW